MHLLKVIKPIYFFAALVIGLFVTYVMQPAPEVVVKFPSPYNARKIVYKDKAGACYTYKATNEECPINKASIKPQPTYETFRV